MKMGSLPPVALGPPEDSVMYSPGGVSACLSEGVPVHKYTKTHTLRAVWESSVYLHAIQTWKDFAVSSGNRAGTWFQVATMLYITFTTLLTSVRMH